MSARSGEWVDMAEFGSGDVPAADAADLDRIEVFRSTVEVMLEDGVLTREEKRIIIRLAKALGLRDDEPGRVYAAIQRGEAMEAGEPLSRTQQREVYGKVVEVALLNASLSRDEFRVLQHLQSLMHISVDEHNAFLARTEEIARDRLRDPRAIERVMETVRDLSDIVVDGIRRPFNGRERA